MLANRNCCVRPDQLLIRVEGLIRKLRIWIKKRFLSIRGFKFVEKERIPERWGGGEAKRVQRKRAREGVRGRWAVYARAGPSVLGAN